MGRNVPGRRPAGCSVSPPGAPSTVPRCCHFIASKPGCVGFTPTPLVSGRCRLCRRPCHTPARAAGTWVPAPPGPLLSPTRWGCGDKEDPRHTRADHRGPSVQQGTRRRLRLERSLLTVFVQRLRVPRLRPRPGGRVLLRAWLGQCCPLWALGAPACWAAFSGGAGSQEKEPLDSLQGPQALPGPKGARHRGDTARPLQVCGISRNHRPRGQGRRKVTFTSFASPSLRDSSLGDAVRPPPSRPRGGAWVAVPVPEDSPSVSGPSFRTFRVPPSAALRRRRAGSHADVRASGFWHVPHRTLPAPQPQTTLLSSEQCPLSGLVFLHS